VTTDSGATYAFDSIECAAQMLAPVCLNCGCRILGHGVDGPEGVFCCASCARAEGVGAVDQARVG